MCIAIFTLDYLARFITVPEKNFSPDASPTKRFLITRYQFVIAVFNAIDLVAIVPFYVSQISGAEETGPFAALRVMRLIRIVRVFKLGKHSRAVNTFMQAMRLGKPAAIMLIVFLFAYFLLFGALLFECERDAPGNLGFTSIPGSFWWAVVTVTTVGYGDVYPVTNEGRIVCCIAAVAGVVGITLPLSIIGVFFAEIWDMYTAEKLEKKKAKENGEGNGSEKDTNVSGINTEIEMEALAQPTEADYLVAVEHKLAELNNEFPMFRLDQSSLKVLASMTARGELSQRTTALS